MTTLNPAVTITAGVVLTTFASILADWKQRQNDRIEQLAAAEKLLIRHNQTMEEFLSSESPESVKDALVIISDRLADAKFVKQTLDSIDSDSVGIDYDVLRSSEFYRDLMQLSEQRADLAAMFRDSVSSGFLGACLRFDETATAFEKLAVSVASNNTRELGVVARVFQSPDLKPGQFGPERFAYA